VKRLIQNSTLTKREFGNRLASKYDFHALRTTFVTLALSAGIGVEILKALTGHATVEIVMRHYFKPKGSDFINELTKAMPKVLTAKKRVKAAQLIPPKVTEVLRFIKKKGLNKDEIEILKEQL
jgi:integrase